MTTRRDNGWTLTAGALAAVAISALAVTAGGPIAPSAEAAAPGIAATCGGAVVTKDATVNASLEPTATPDDANPATARTYVAGPPRTSVINVTGAQPYLRDLDLRTLIKHEASKDVTITLTAPTGKVYRHQLRQRARHVRRRPPCDGLLSQRWPERRHVERHSLGRPGWRAGERLRVRAGQRRHPGRLDRARGVAWHPDRYQPQRQLDVDRSELDSPLRHQ